MRSWSEIREARRVRKLRHTEREVLQQRGVLPWDQLTRTQQGFWETRYRARLIGMLDRSAKFRELGQSIRFVSALMGATVAALGGFAGAPTRIIVAVLGVALAAVNAAPSIFSTEGRVVINRRYVGLLLTEGWIFALAIERLHDAGTDRSATDISAAFETFRAAVEKRLGDYDTDYEKSIYAAGHN